MNSKPRSATEAAFAAFDFFTATKPNAAALADLEPKFLVCGSVVVTSAIDLVWIVFDAPKVITAPKMAIKPVPIRIFLGFLRACWMKAREYDDRPL
jgi:hypothetical protein